MAAETNRFRPISRRFLAGTLRMCALLALVAFAGGRSGAQSAPPQQAPPAQPATPQSTPTPAQPAPDAQSTPATPQKNADADDDKWPEPEWATQQNQAGAPANSAPQAPAPAAPASNQPSTGAPSASPATPNNATPTPAPVAQSTPAPAGQDSIAVPTQPTTQQAAATASTGPATDTAPAQPRPDYAGMTPEEKRKEQVAQQCADLLKLATDLKAQVDKARKDELSLTVVRKATEVEQMAHKVRSGTALSSSNE